MKKVFFVFALLLFLDKVASAQLATSLKTAADKAYALLEMPLADAKAKIVREEGAGTLDWCGYTVSNLYKQAGADPKITNTYFGHTQRLLYFGSYYTLDYAQAPGSGDLIQRKQPLKTTLIKDNGTFVKLRDYHAQRGSLRQVILFDQIVAGGALDILPGDIVLLDHRGKNGPDHIQIVYNWNEATRTLIVIDGNGGSFALSKTSAQKVAIKPNEKSEDKILLQEKLNIITNFMQQEIVYPGVGTGRVGISCHKLVPEHQVTFKQTNGAHARIWAIIRPSMVDFERHEYKNL